MQRFESLRIDKRVYSVYKSCCMLMLAVDKLSNKTETQVGAQHMCFVVCYVTFRAAYSVAITFTVLLLLIRHLNRLEIYSNHHHHHHNNLLWRHSTGARQRLRTIHCIHYTI